MSETHTEPLGAGFQAAEGEAQPSPEALPVGLPSPAISPFQFSIPTLHNHTSLTSLVNDERAISRLLEILLVKGGLSIGGAARQLGVTDEAVRQYLTGRRSNPSLKWFLRFAQLCGAKVTIEFPAR